MTAPIVKVMVANKLPATVLAQVFLLVVAGFAVSLYILPTATGTANGILSFHTSNIPCLRCFLFARRLSAYILGHHQFLSPKILPDAMYADLKEIYAGIPQEVFSTMPPVFAISDQFIMITEPLLHIFRHFYLGSTQISPVRLYERTTNELLSEQTYYLLNVCETHSYL